MKKLVLPEINIPEDRQADVTRIVEVCYESGYLIGRATAYFAWKKFSDNMDAGWLNIPSTDAILVDSVLSVTQVADLDNP